MIIMATRQNLSLRNSSNAQIGLHDLCSYIVSIIGKNITGIEIGVFSGISTAIFASFFEKIYAIDMWESEYDPTGLDYASDPKLYNMKEVEAHFDNICEQAGNITKIKKSSKEASKSFKNKFFDFVYIDANHNYEHVKEDITLWLPKAKYFICGHDYHSKHHKGVQKAVNEIFKVHSKTFRDSSWIVQL